MEHGFDVDKALEDTVYSMRDTGPDDCVTMRMLHKILEAGRVDNVPAKSSESPRFQCSICHEWCYARDMLGQFNSDGTPNFTCTKCESPSSGGETHGRICVCGKVSSW